MTMTLTAHTILYMFTHPVAATIAISKIVTRFTNGQILAREKRTYN